MTRKRNKAYHPRRIRVPMTRGLLDSFAQELHFSLMTATQGHFSKIGFDKIGSCLNVIHGALEVKPPKDRATLVVIEGAIRAMNDCGDRGARSGVWTLTLEERASVTAGAQKAEEALAFLDVLTLHESMQNLKRRELEETIARRKAQQEAEAREALAV